MNNLYEPISMQIERIVQETDDASLRSFELSFQKETDKQAFFKRYNPGQFCQLSIFGKGEAPFGIASAAWEGDFVRFTVQNVGSFTDTIHRSQVGDSIGMRGPLGNGFPIQGWKGKDVVVIGGANSAAKAALYLADICNKVTVVYRKHEMTCEPISLSKICSTSNIEIKYFAKPLEVVGDGVVKGLRVLREEPEKKVLEETLDVSGVFIEAGAVPATEVLKDLDLTMEKNYVITGKDCKTNVDGVFAAGDVTNVAMRQMITAAGEGAIAAKGAHEYLLNISAGA